MSRLLLMLCWLPLTVSVPRVPPAPEKLLLKSHDLKHVLQWERGAGTSAEVSYSVSFHTNRGPCCTVVPGCEQVVDPLLCDLSKAFSEPEETYHLRVTAHEQSEQTSTSAEPFHPIRDTELQPPVLQVALCNSSLCVHMDSPLSLLHSLYQSLHYELKVESTASLQPTLMSFRSLRSLQIPGVRQDSRYCVSVRFADRIVPRESSFGPAHCVSYSSSHPVLPLVLLSGLLLLLLLSAVFYSYIHHNKPALPSVLTSVRHSSEKLEVSCHPAVSSLLFIQTAPPTEQTEDCSSESKGDEHEPYWDYTNKGSLSSQHYNNKGSLSSQHYTSKGSLSSQHDTSKGSLSSQHDTSKGSQFSQHDTSKGSQFSQYYTNKGSLSSQHDTSKGSLSSQHDTSKGSQSSQHDTSKGSQSSQHNTSKGFLSSQHDTSKGSQSSQSSQHSASQAWLHMEEVDLLTLTFSRDTEEETGAWGLCEEELQLCERIEDTDPHQKHSEEERSGTGYMRRPN